jgi:hypothetical protein
MQPKSTPQGPSPPHDTSRRDVSLSATREAEQLQKQGQDYQKLHENRQLALFWNTQPLAAGVLYLVSCVNNISDYVAI